MVEIESQLPRFTSRLSIRLSVHKVRKKAGVIKERSAILVVIVMLRNCSLALSYNGGRLASRV